MDLVEINPSCKHYVYIQFTFCRSFQFVLSLSLFLSLSFFCLYLMLFFVLELLLLRVAWFELLLLLFVFVFFAVSEFCFTSANFTCDSCKTVQDCRNGRRFGTGFRCDRRWQSNEIMGIVQRCGCSYGRLPRYVSNASAETISYFARKHCRLRQTCFFCSGTTCDSCKSVKDCRDGRRLLLCNSSRREGGSIP